MSLARRYLIGCLAIATFSGCSQRVVIPRESLEAGSDYSDTRVLTTDGLEYQFDAVLVLPDSLVGEYTLEVQRQSVSSGVYYEDVTRSQSLPIHRVTSLSTKKRDPGKTLFFGAGVFAAGMAIKTLVDSDLGSGGGGNSKHKPDPDG